MINPVFPASEAHLILHTQLTRAADHRTRQSLISSVIEHYLSLEAGAGLVAEVQAFVEQVLAVDQQLRPAEADADVAVDQVERLPCEESTAAVGHRDRIGIAVIGCYEQAD